MILSRVYGRIWNLYNLKIFVHVQNFPPFHFPRGVSDYGIDSQNLTWILLVIYKVLHFGKNKQTIIFCTISKLVYDFPPKVIHPLVNFACLCCLSLCPVSWILCVSLCLCLCMYVGVCLFCIGSRNQCDRWLMIVINFTTGSPKY